jgi:hypothetical protein
MSVTGARSGQIQPDAEGRLGRETTSRKERRLRLALLTSKWLRGMASASHGESHLAQISHERRFLECRSY